MKTSLLKLWQDTHAVFRRFPISMTLAVVAAVVGILMVRQEPQFYRYMDFYENPLPEAYLRLFHTTILGIFLFAGVKLYQEQQKKVSEVPVILSAIFLVFYYFLLPVQGERYLEEVMFTNFFYGVSFLFLIPTMPFLGQEDEKGHWNYFKALFVRLFFTVVFTGVLFAGVSLLFAGLEELFGIYFDSNIYLQWWLIAALVIGTTYFLLGVPEKITKTQKATDYPKLVRVFSQYILLPLLSLYAIMLYAYSIKEIIVLGRPDIFVIPMVIIFGLATLLMYFLFQPLLSQKKEAWAKKLSTAFLILFLPSLGLLGWSLILNFQIEGLNEGIYFGFLFAFWLLGSVFYLLASPKKQFRHVFGAFVILSILSSFGPWGATGLSTNYQLVQFQSILTQNGLLVEGEIVKAEPDSVSREDRARITEALDYLVWDVGISGEALGFSGLDSYCVRDISCLMAEGLGLEPDYGFGMEDGLEMNFASHFFAERSQVDIAGYTSLINDIYYYEHQEGYGQMAEGQKIEAALDGDLFTIRLEDGSAYSFSLTSMFDQLQDVEFDFDYKPSSNVDPSLLTLEIGDAKLLIEYVSVWNIDSPDERRIEDLGARLLIK